MPVDGRRRPVDGLSDFVCRVYSGTRASAIIGRSMALCGGLSHISSTETKHEFYLRMGLTRPFFCATMILVSWSKQGASGSVAQYRNSEVYHRDGETVPIGAPLFSSPGAGQERGAPCTLTTMNRPSHSGAVVTSGGREACERMVKKEKRRH